MADDVTERVRKTVSTILKVPAERVQPSAHLVRDLGMESIKSVELIAALEEEFDIEIDEDNIGDVVTVEKAIDYVRKAL
jgi:acyl carrier protein